MKKLDNHGWGFTIFIVFIFVFFLAILMVVYLVNHFESGLSSERENIRYSQFETYRKYEKIVKKVAEDYFATVDETSVDIYQLEISNAIRSQCSGYALLEGSTVSVYLKCGRYQTPGFSSQNVY